MKIVRMAAAAVLVAALAGCATQQSDSGPRSSEPSTTGGDSAATERARIHTQLAAGYYEIGRASCRERV